MSNQMIALQAKGPQLADPAAQTAKFVNMMNMTKQQEAAERQAAQAQQAMTLAQRKDLREEALQGPALTKAELDNIRAQIDDLEEQYKMVSTEEGHQFWLNRVRKVDAAIADQIGMYAPNFDPEKVNYIMLTAKQAVDKIDPDAKATIEYAGKGGVDEQGNPIPEGTAIQVITGSKPSTRVIRNAPNASSPAPAAAPQTPAGPVPTGKFGAARVVPEASVPLTPYQQDHIRRMQEDLGMTNTPTSFNSGSMGTPTASRMSPDMVPAILDSAVKTGVMAQIDLDQIIAMAPPQARQGIMDVIRTNKIALQADAPSLAASGMSQRQPMAPNPVQRPQAQFADLRGPAPQSQTAGLRGAPPMEQTLAQYQPLQRRDPNVSPAPGVYNVPTSQVAEKARAERETPAEAAAKARAVAAVNAEAETAKKAAEKLPGRKQVSTIISKIRNAYEQLDKAQAIPSETRGGFANAMDYIASSSLGREAQKMVGTKSSKYLSEIINSRKLLATAIKNATGMSAQEMNSNVELQLTLDALTDPTQGIEAARSTLGTLEELYGTPRTAPVKRQTPIKSSSGWGTAKVVGN